MYPTSFTTPEIALRLAGPAGSLEVAVLQENLALSQPMIAVIAHPHPLFGGTMNNKVVTTLARAFRDLGIQSVRFNYRGVGNSEGKFAEGIGESEDTIWVRDWVLQNNPTKHILLCGFSFGAYCALNACQDKVPRLLVMVAPAIAHMAYEKLHKPHCPWLIVQGTADEIVSIDATREYVALHRDENLQFVELPEVGHFFHGQLGALKTTVSEFVSKNIP